MNKIQIVNWLLTRRCNLRCGYCAIVRDYKNKPNEYPDMKHYQKFEMSTEDVISTLTRLNFHNPNCFHIFYGGEPLLRYDLHHIINFCNVNNIYYTIISNNTEEIQPSMDRFLNNVETVAGFTASIDPIIYENQNNDIFKKSFRGLKKLQEYSTIIKDVVAEITVTNDNLKYLYRLVEDLTNLEINSDITFVDISKNDFYDFSNIHDESILVKPSNELNDILYKIVDNKLNVHMRDKLLNVIFETLPSNFDCELEKNIHNLCIDADGSIRLCLRIRGVETPKNINIKNFLNYDYTINENLNKNISIDKKLLCQLCNHSCYMMSKITNENNNEVENLVHLKERSEK